MLTFQLILEFVQLFQFFWACNFFALYGDDIFQIENYLYSECITIFCNSVVWVFYLVSDFAHDAQNRVQNRWFPVCYFFVACSHR